VAIRASHEALVDTVLEGLGELSPDAGVAGVADIALLFGEECFLGPGLVDGMTGIAGYAGEGMRRPAEVGPAERFGMAAEAVVEYLLGS
jgi:hypothetical protein